MSARAGGEEDALLLRRLVDGRTDLVFAWTARGGAADATDAGGRPLALWCAYHGDVSALRHLLTHGASLEALGPNFDLVGAAFHGHWALCQFLLEAGADAGAPLAATGETPLHAALSTANRPAHDFVVEVLLAHGADPNARTLAGAETGSFMRDARTTGETPLHRAAAFGSERALDLLLEAGAEREARDARGDTPLAWASWHLRPPPILRRLCFGDHHVHPGNTSTYDHGVGWKQPLGRPHLPGEPA